jgi:hypothetical protein
MNIAACFHIKKKRGVKTLFSVPALVALIFLFVASLNVFAECQGDLNCDGMVDGSDLAQFAKDFDSTDCPACLPAPVVKTGQAVSFASGDDGDLQMGVAWPDPRFTDNGDGTVTDNLTGLVWLKNANCYGHNTWAESLVSCNNLADGQCGLSDGSSIGDWHLPNIREFHSLVDFGGPSSPLPSGHPFTGVQVYYYWSSTTRADWTHGAWLQSMANGRLKLTDKLNLGYYVWPVRAGN